MKPQFLPFIRRATLALLALPCIPGCAVAQSETIRGALVAEFRAKFPCRPVYEPVEGGPDSLLAREACWVVGAVVAEIGAGRAQAVGVASADTMLLMRPRVSTKYYKGLDGARDDAAWLVEFELRGREVGLLAYVNQFERNISFKLLPARPNQP